MYSWSNVLLRDGVCFFTHYNSTFVKNESTYLFEKFGVWSYFYVFFVTIFPYFVFFNWVIQVWKFFILRNLERICRLYYLHFACNLIAIFFKPLLKLVPSSWYLYLWSNSTGNRERKYVFNSSVGWWQQIVIGTHIVHVESAIRFPIEKKADSLSSYFLFGFILPEIGFRVICSFFFQFRENVSEVFFICRSLLDR